MSNPLAYIRSPIECNPNVRLNHRMHFMIYTLYAHIYQPLMCYHISAIPVSHSGNAIGSLLHAAFHAEFSAPHSHNHGGVNNPFSVHLGVVPLQVITLVTEFQLF